MKLQLTLLSLSALIVIGGPIGCKKSDEASGGYGGSASTAPAIDLTKVENAFASTTGAIKAEWDKVVTALKSQDYSGAWASLQTLASNAGLTGDQKSALADLMAQVKAKAGDALKSAADAASKVASDTKDAAGKAVDQAKEAAGNVLPK